MSIKLTKIFLTALLFIAVISFSMRQTNIHANSSGPSASRTGAPAVGTFGAELNCTSSGCHSTYLLNSGTGTFSISGLPTYYFPDQEITVTVTMNQASRGAYGFQMTALDAQGNRAGTFTTSDNRTQLLNGTGSFTGRRYIQHSLSGISPNGTNQGSWTFKWKAPATPSGKITFFGAGNAANGTGTSSNDYIYTTSKSIDPLPYAAVSAASYAPSNIVTSEMIGALFSVGLASGVQVASGDTLPTQLGETTLEFQDSTGRIANSPLFFVSDGQINFLVPQNTPAGTAQVRVKRNGTAVMQGAVDVQQVSPGLFTAANNGQGVAAALALRVSNTGAQTYEGVARFAPGTQTLETIPIDVNPANGQVFLVLYGTGIRWRSGLSGATVSVRGVSYPALYAGPAGGYFGLDQVNIGPLPASLVGAGAVDVVLTVDGKTANTVSLSFK
jgi:uncharacterized protein (TIGR03437 family)